MASKKKKAAAAAGGAAGAARAAKNSPYVQEVVTNDELRDNIQQAYDSAREAYERIASSKKPAKAIFDDKKLQKDLKTAADSIRDAGLALKEAPKGGSKKKGGGLFRKLLLITIAAGLALALSEDLRKKVLDALFGAEEEFEYTSTTTASNGGASGGVTTPASTA
ncbi:MAG: hypothetical protein QOI80_728 [Solirubrobacteraceae bacterium]|jgi:hypothetical protein|nr:hypothetical protein [Solirubrobacteraceae bacterium]